MGRLELEGSVDKAVRMLRSMGSTKNKDPDKNISHAVIANAKGIVFFSIIKVGIAFLGGQIGTGCIIVKIKDESDPRGYRWSGPSAIKTGGLGGGFIWGGEKVDTLMILNTDFSVKCKIYL